MNLPLTFQLKIPAPKCAPFAGLAAQCKDGEILSIDYLPDGCFKQAKVEAADSQSRQLVSDLGDLLNVYFDSPNPTCFKELQELPLCYSELHQRVDNSGVKLPPDECRQALEKIHREDICAYGEFCAYKKIGARVWNNEQSVRKYERIKSRADAIGKACIVNPLAIVVPCFRIIRSGDTLGEFLGNRYLKWETGQAEEIGRQIKRWLLMHEGHDVVKPDEGADRMSEWEVHRKPS